MLASTTHTHFLPASTSAGRTPPSLGARLPLRLEVHVLFLACFRVALTSALGFRHLSLLIGRAGRSIVGGLVDVSRLDEVLHILAIPTGGFVVAFALHVRFLTVTHVYSSS